MKNNKRITILILGLMFSLMSLALAFRANLVCPKAYADGELESVIDKSEILFSPTLISKTSSNFIAFDEYDGLIKIFDSNYDCTRTIELDNCISLATQNNLLFTLTDDPAIKVFDINTGSLVDSILNANKEDNELIGAKRIAVYQASETKIYCLVQKYKENINSFELYSLVYLDETWSFSESRLTIDSSRIEIPSEVNSILIVENNDSEYKNIVVCYANNIAYFALRPESVSATSYTLNNLYSSTTPTDTLTNLIEITENEQTYIGVLNNDKISLLSRSISPNLALSVNLLNQTIEADSKTQLCGYLNEIYCSVSGESKVNKLTYADSQLSSEKVIESGTITLSDLDSKDFKYYKTTIATTIYSSPFGGNNVAVIDKNAHFCQTKIVKVDNQTLEGFIYGVFVTNSTNYYGYVDTSKLLPLEESDFSLNIAYAYANTQMFSLPSKVTDSTNSVIKTFPVLTKLTVVASKCNNNFNSSVNSFCLVKTENDEYGFVLTARIQAMPKSRTLITNNATINKLTSVYLENDPNSTVIDVIDEQTRVHVIGKTDKQTKLIKIEYVNNSGDLITGFIPSSNISTDGWSVLQIVGLILITVNVTFLLVLFFVKKKINHD